MHPFSVVDFHSHYIISLITPSGNFISHQRNVQDSLQDIPPGKSSFVKLSKLDATHQRLKLCGNTERELLPNRRPSDDWQSGAHCCSRSPPTTLDRCYHTSDTAHRPPAGLLKPIFSCCCICVPFLSYHLASLCLGFCLTGHHHFDDISL